MSDRNLVIMCKKLFLGNRPHRERNAYGMASLQVYICLYNGFTNVISTQDKHACLMENHVGCRVVSC